MATELHLSHARELSPAAERLRIREVIVETNDMSEDDESPLHRLGEDEKHHAVLGAHRAFGNIMNFLEYDRFEEITMLVNQLGGALRK